MKHKSVQNFLICCKDRLKSQYNFFCRVFVTLILVEFNLIAYANNTTCDVTMHNAFEKDQFI